MAPDALPVDAPEASTRTPSMEDVLIESARLHAMRASILRIEVANARRDAPRLVGRLMRTRTGHRVRFVMLIARRTTTSLREDGLAGTLTRVAGRLLPGRTPRPNVRNRHPANHSVGAATQIVRRDDPKTMIYRNAIGVPAGRVLRHRVLLAAELGIPQCAKYRVWQKKDLFEQLGLPCTVVDWTRVHDVLSMLQTHTLLIMYRVGAHPGPLEVIDEARRLGVESVWEVDDLIFDVALYGANSNLRDIPAWWREELLDGAAMYRRAMITCDRTIGSTACLSQLMGEASGKPSHVVPNALDDETLAFASAAVAGRQRRDGQVVIGYGSGTLTHDTDFALACPALLRLLDEQPHVRLLVLGSLNLPATFGRFEDRIDRMGLTNFKAYLAALASVDISLAPLEVSVFNDAKSNIKLIEASILGLPSICSPRSEFRRSVTSGVDGFLAETDEEWYSAFRALVDDPVYRVEVGRRSRERILRDYAPEAIARRDVEPLAALISKFERRPLRILAVNIFFKPRTYGGATVVAEEMVERLADRGDTDMFVFTSHGLPAPQYTLRRYEARGASVVGIALPVDDDILNFDNPEMAAKFADVLAAVAPDVVHFHSIQQFGAGIVRACQLARIPYVITVHDAWWLCTRQFMVRQDNKYCYQTTVDLKVCERCVPHMHHLQSRMDILKQALLGAARIISPSESHGALHRANGVSAQKLVVNRNGVRWPKRPRRKRPSMTIRFGYVGGNHTLKGVDLIRTAFTQLDRVDWALVIVDNTLNLGFSSYNEKWRMRGQVEFVPAYQQDSMDEFFESIDILLFPSQWKESFGLTVREALVRDVWVIATDSGGAAEDIVPGVNGSLIPMGDDPAPLVAAVTEMLDRASMFDSFVNPHKHRIATLENQARELHDILKEAAFAGSKGAAGNDVHDCQAV